MELLARLQHDRRPWDVWHCYQHPSRLQTAHDPKHMVELRRNRRLRHFSKDEYQCHRFRLILNAKGPLFKTKKWKKKEKKNKNDENQKEEEKENIPSGLISSGTGHSWSLISSLPWSTTAVFGFVNNDLSIGFDIFNGFLLLLQLENYQNVKKNFPFYSDLITKLAMNNW
mgnify:CR=1 FL=1